MTALIVAVKGGYTQSVKEILKRNPNVNLTDKDGNTALMIASKEGHTEIVQDLLDAGTYVNIPDRVGACRSSRDVLLHRGLALGAVSSSQSSLRGGLCASGVSGKAGCIPRAALLLIPLVVCVCRVGTPC